MIMRVNELRIVNYLLLYGKVVKVTEVGFKNDDYYLRVEGNKNGHYLDQFEPIELTEEILLKCGFAEFYKSDFSVKLECIKNPIFEFVRRNHKDWNLRIKGETHKHIKYLHQLQNLYFALTGKELEIELWKN